jgi:hypothetical protein
MSWWRRKEREEDLQRELHDHLEIEASEQQEEGLSSEEARSAARRLFGNTTLVAEEVREMWGMMWLGRLWQDLRYGGRGLFRSPVFTLVSVLSLALGIGATVTIFSVFEAVFFDGVTANNVERVKHVEIGGGQRFSFRFYEELSTSHPALAVLAAFDQTSLSFRSKNDLEKITGDVVSGNFFDVLGIAPFLGRTFTSDEGAERRPRAVVLSYSFWERKFAAGPKRSRKPDSYGVQRKSTHCRNRNAAGTRGDPYAGASDGSGRRQPFGRYGNGVGPGDGTAYYSTPCRITIVRDECDRSHQLRVSRGRAEHYWTTGCIYSRMGRFTR